MDHFWITFLICWVSLENSLAVPYTPLDKLTAPLSIFGNILNPKYATNQPKPSPSTTSTTRSTTTSTTTPPPRKANTISEKKCLEYYPEPEYPILSIAGGNQSLAKEFPHMAAIGYEGDDGVEWLCGGSLISKKYVLTAAHCIKNRVGSPKFIRLGDLDISTDTDDAQPQEFTVVKTIIHPNYKSPSRYHDIGLIELDREAQFTEYVSPACLNTNRDINATILTATGWGKLGFSDSSSSFLLKVNLDHVPNDNCVQIYGRVSKTALPNGIDDDIQICAGKVKGQDTCEGDSGGPLQTKNEERSLTVNVHNIFGVTSFGKACALAATPGIYTRVSTYIPWIESIVWKDE